MCEVAAVGIENRKDGEPNEKEPSQASKGHATFSFDP